MSWRHLPAPARPIAAAVSGAVTAARARDPEEFRDAADELAGLDPAQLGLVLGTLVRLLMEDLHPDGLDADDVRAVLADSVRASAQWQPEVDPQIMLLLLAGALGVYDPDGSEAMPKPDVVARHGALLVTHLAAEQPTESLLTRAFAEIERAQLND